MKAFSKKLLSLTVVCAMLLPLLWWASGLCRAC